MLPYLAMLALPGIFALTGAKRAGLVLLLVVTVYWVMTGFRYQVGMDWYNYANLYRVEQRIPWDDIPGYREPGFVFLNRIAGVLGGGPILVNAVSALVFTGGLYAIARRCREPLLAIVVATPLLVVGLAMSGIRQAIALGIIFYLFATWENRSTLARFLLVLFASLFHFSATFVLIYVALASRAPLVVRVAAAVVVGIIMAAVVHFAPRSVEAYSRLYIGPMRKGAPGALVQIAPIALAGLVYLIRQRAWVRLHGDDPLVRNLAWSSLVALLVVPISSVGAYRFSLYFWTMAMVVWAGLPSLIESGTGRLFYRLTLVLVSFAMLAGWLLFANNSWAWLPYRSWLLQPPGAPIWRHGH